jgi:fructokinase
LKTAMMDVITCGEMLIDFVSTETGVSLAQAPAFKKAPGGAPANVAVGVAQLGYRAGFIGQVGNDEFGHFLADTLQSYEVDTTGLRFTSLARTALAFVSLRADGEREFMFYRHPSADMLWHPEDVDRAYVAHCHIFHYGSISLIDEPSRGATLTALDYAKSNGALLSYDPNLRLSLWPSPDAARAGILDGWQYAEIIKVSEEELTFLSDKNTLERAARSLWHDRLRLLAVTQGRAGCTYFTAEAQGYMPGFAVRSVDTTGAGDGFVAGMLAGLLEDDLKWNREVIEKALCLGNAVGALSTMQLGAISSLPTMTEAKALLQRAERQKANERTGQ